MLSFALGTLPMLLTIGFSTLKLATKPHLSGQFLKTAGVLVLFFGLYNLNNQLNVLGWPSLDDLKFRSANFAQVTGNGLAPIVNGKQILKMDASAYGYDPNEFKVRAGLPVKWEIRNKGVSGCTNGIISHSLFPDQIRIDKDLVIKEFTPEKPGKYKFSCWMGMVSGTIRVIDQNSSTDENDKEIPSDVSRGNNRSSCNCGCGS
jgi:plastocyanin